MSGSKMLVSDEEKRWVVVGIAINKVVAPVLRDTIKQGMDTHYNNLDTHCNGLPVPCTLRTLTYHQASTDGTLRTLKFGNINNNTHLYGNMKSMYNFSVSSSVDLAKLYLPDYLAKFAAFDESMDMSAILRLLGFCRPAPIFPSPNPALSIQSAADDVKDSVRNKWGHCDVNEWTEAFFNDCFTKLEALVRSVGLTAGMEKIIVDQLSDWKTKGCQLCMGHAVDQSLLSLVQQEVLSLKNQHLAFAAQVGEQERSLGTILAQQDEQAKQVEDNKEILDRLVFVEGVFRQEVLNRIQQLESGFAQFKRQLREDMDTREQTQASPAEPFDVETCRSKLADHYTRTARIPTTVWSAIHHVDIHQIYTRLSWVREEHTTTGSSQTKLEHYTDVFRQIKNGVLPKRILVQGQTGIGKSTFVKRLAVDWAELHHEGSTGERKEAVDCAELDQEEMSDEQKETGSEEIRESITFDEESEESEVESVSSSSSSSEDEDPFDMGKWTDERKKALRKFELVLVVKLRDVKQCQGLRDIISYSHILSKDDSTLMTGLLDFVAKNQEKVLLVLDGYDEYSGKNESVILEIFQRDILRDCCVVVTSRPSKADELRGFADVHAEITGFSEEDINGFMWRMLGSRLEADSLRRCLAQRNLLELASVPLLLLFYCTLWKKGKWESFPENRTELYMSIVQCLLDYGHGKRAAGCYSKVGDYKEILAELGKVALEALLKDDLVFEYDKLSEAVRCEGSRIIGLLQVTEYAENVRPAGKVSFIHKSIQEFLAAWYISHTCIPEGNLGQVEEAVNTFEKCLFLGNVFRFVSGLSVDGVKKVFGLLKSVRIYDPTVDVYKTIEMARNFQYLISTYFWEANLEEELLKHCLDCTAGIVFLPTTDSRSSIGKVKDLSAVTDYGDYILTYLLDHATDPFIIPGYWNASSLSMDERSKLLKLADFFVKFQKVVRCYWCYFVSFLWLSDSQIQFYITELLICCDEHALLLSEAFVSPVPSHSADSISSTERSYALSCRTLGEEVAQCSSSPSPTNKLETFCGPPVQPESCFKFLRNASCGRVVDDSICDLLRQVPNPGNCSLGLGVVSLTSAGAVNLASLLPSFNNIPCIELDLKDCSGASVSTLVGSIMHTTLKTLSLKNIDLFPEAAVALGRSLPEMSGLKTLCLVGKGNSLGPGEMELESLFGSFKEKIPLHSLELCCFSVGSSTATLRDGFRLFPDMEVLKLHKLGINEDGITVLAEGFTHLPNLEKLNLSGNPLGHGVRSVMSHITNLPKLFELDLSNTGCTEEDVECFHECFTHLPNLKKLDLSGNPLGHGVRSVMSHITNLPKLRELDLSNTGCTEEDVECFHECFRHLPNLEELNLSGNPLGHGVRSVMSHITNLPELYKLDLGNTDCTEEDVEYFHECVRHLPDLRILDLSGYLLGHGVRSVMSQITNLPKLGKLDLSNTGCTEEDVECFHECFRHLPNLEELNLSGNPLGHGVRSVMSHITNLLALYKLDLSNTGCTEEDVECFHECFRHLPRLNVLNLSGNPLGHGVRSVMSHITNLPKLRELDLSNTGCTEEDVEYFHEGINTLMQVWDARQKLLDYPFLLMLGNLQLNLSRNPLGHGVRSIVSNIPNFPMWGELNLRDTGCSEEDVRYVRETMKSRQLQHDVVKSDTDILSGYKQFFIKL